MSQPSQEKRTRSQLTIDQFQQNLDQSPLKLARTAVRSKHNNQDGELKGVGNNNNNITEEGSDAEEDELLLSPNKPKPRFLSPAKRPPSPFQGSSRTPSEEREAKRAKKGPDPIANVLKYRIESAATPGSPVRAESAAPESPRRPSSLQVPPRTARAQSVPIFPESQSLPHDIFGYRKNGIPLLNLAHPSLSPSRHRAASPEKVFKIVPIKPAQLEAIADRDESTPIEEQPVNLLPEETRPFTPPQPVIPLQEEIRPTTPPQLVTPVPETPETKIVSLDLGSPLTPVPPTPWPNSKNARREQLLQEAMAKDLADSEKRLAATPSREETKSPSLKRKVNKSSPNKTPTNKSSVKASIKPSSLLKPPIAASSSFNNKPANGPAGKPAGGASLKQKKTVTTFSALAPTKTRKPITGKASAHYPKEDKRSLLGSPAKVATKLSMKSQVKPRVKEVPKPVPHLDTSNSDSLDTVVTEPQPMGLPESSSGAISHDNQEESTEEKPRGGYSRSSSLTPIESELTDLSGVSSPQAPPTILPEEATNASQLPLAVPQSDTPAPSEQATPKAAPPKSKASVKRGQRLSKPSSVQPRATRSSSLRKRPGVEKPPETTSASKSDSIPTPTAKHPFDTVDAANELLRMATSSAPARSPRKESGVTPKSKRHPSAPVSQVSSRFLGKNGEPSALDNLNRALAKLRPPPSASRPASSAGSSSSKLSDDGKAETEKGDSSSRLPRKSTTHANRGLSSGPRVSNAKAGPSKLNSGKIDAYFKPKPFLPAGSGTGKGTVPRNSLGPATDPKKPQGFGPTFSRANKVSKQPTLPSVLASPVKANADYVEYEVDLPDESMEVEEVPIPDDVKGKGKGKERESSVILMGPPELPSTLKKEPESPLSDMPAKSQRSRRKTDEFPTVSSDSADILSGCVAFVDIRTENGDSAGDIFAEMLQSMGARVLKAVGQTCTHIIYKDGLASTLNKLRALPEPKPKLVSLTWVAACAEQGIHVDEESYLLDLADISFGGVVRRRRSILPKIFAQDQEEPILPSEDEGNRPPSRTRRRNRPS